MKTPPCLSVLPALALLALTAAAQSGTPVTEPPPTSPAGASETSAAGATSSARAANAPGLLDTTNSTGKSSGNNVVKELRFAAVDADSDGLISLAEFTTFMDAGNMPRAENADRSSATETLFRSIDRNNDRFLSEAEVTAYQDEQDRNGSKR
jgi:hypothetical protein